ncbi:hypothetical protein HS088_TW09G00964 [Tripterygium wilfordii]|uniref:Rab-GAP TBC domain-containing protein n=1 Tax=Tripterygium wilfordii TaxID=458696 RepID=A0A7J7D986_TRIWF|nr:uncharacterized protein LOC120004806 [Tripterygium wilfordii]KAF5742902.1 hypothetical protein HS088_TW09G00964 [Tripterygium wilfordii]
MSPAPIEHTLQESSSCSRSYSVDNDNRGRFDSLRGVQWRINLGVLPSSPSPSIDDFRRVTADFRRRYAGLRRRLLVDPHVPKDGSNSPNLVMDNPLSQNPDSTWGRFFRNAELEKMVDQDLSRLYPEHGNYFQTPGCQGMLRRILLLWCLRHPEYGYRQGMHELLAPLLYVLQVDTERLSEVRKLYEDHFTDKFDGLSSHEKDLIYNFDSQKLIDSIGDENNSHGNAMTVRSLDDLDPEIKTIVMLSDAYGAEGELGIVLSEKFIEHDAYCMFDALMSGGRGYIAMADFFSPSPASGSQSGLPPVIEASTALYHLLSIVDSSLHSHLVELGVEPQYFALRWLRVLFGREFSLENLLIVWDEIFVADSGNIENGTEDDICASFGILRSPRGAFISGVAVSMILYMRSSLLATENATSCLQRLLNFPEKINLQKLMEKAKSLQALALDTNLTSFSHLSNEAYNSSKSAVLRGQGVPSDSISPKTPLNVVPDSYWEEKWRVMHKSEELRQNSLGKENRAQKKRWSEKVRLRLSRAESSPSPAKVENVTKDPMTFVRRSLQEDLSKELGLDKDIEKVGCHEAFGPKNPLAAAVEAGEDTVHRDFTCTAEEGCLNGNVGSEENSSVFSDPPSPHSGDNDLENESEKSSSRSNIFIDEHNGNSPTAAGESPLPISDPPENAGMDFESNDESMGKPGIGLKERKLLSGKFQWFWKFGRAASGQGTSEKGQAALEASNSSAGESNQSNALDSSAANESHNASSSGKGDVVDQNVIDTLRNLGQSMLEHIQVIESVFQQEQGQVESLENFSKNIMVGKGQGTAITALKELRKIGNFLSEM